MSEFSKEKIRTSIVIGIGAILLLWIILSERLFFEAKVYGLFGVVTILGLFAFQYFWKNSRKKESLDKAYFGVSNHWVRGILIGIGFALLFLLLTKVKFFGSVAQLITPTLSLASAGATFIVVFGLAPIFEENGVTATLLSYLNLYMPFWLSVVLKGFFFASIHYYAYVIIAHTTLVNALGAFIGAGIFGMGTAVLAKYVGLEASQSAHSTFNGISFINAFQLLVIAP